MLDTVWWIEVACDADRGGDLRENYTIEEAELMHLAYVLVKEKTVWQDDQFKNNSID